MASGTETPIPNLIHEPPSLPNSPHRKRTKVIEPLSHDAIAGEAYSGISKCHHCTNEQRINVSDSNRATPTPPIAASAPSAIIMDAAAPPLQIQLLSEKGKAPTRGSAFSAGYDLYSAEDTSVPARGKAMVSTGIAIAVPAGTCTSAKHLASAEYGCRY